MAESRLGSDSYQLLKGDLDGLWSDRAPDAHPFDSTCATSGRPMLLVVGSA